MQFNFVSIWLDVDTPLIISIEKKCCRNVFEKAKARQKVPGKKKACLGWMPWWQLSCCQRKYSCHAHMHRTIRFHMEFTLLLFIYHKRRAYIFIEFMDENIMKNNWWNEGIFVWNLWIQKQRSHVMHAHMNFVWSCNVWFIGSMVAMAVCSVWERKEGEWPYCNNF